MVQTSYWFSTYPFRTNYDYHDALEKAILFFEGQRSGPLPPNQRLDWRGNSGTKDGSSDGVDLVGGYYDAGDNIKFGLPMAFTITLLSWSVLEYRNSMGDQRQYAEEAIRWGTDYLLKAAAHIDIQILYVQDGGVDYMEMLNRMQVGNPYEEHPRWERPEDMDISNRRVYKVTAQDRGSEVAAETAAALAAASIVFRKSDPSYSNKLLVTAKKDELLWAASWLYLASKQKLYSNYIQSNTPTSLGDCGGESSFSWDDKKPGTRILLSRAFLTAGEQEFEPFKIDGDNYVCAIYHGRHTPGGLYYEQGSSNLQYVTTSTFLVLNYAKYLKKGGQSASCGTAGVLTADQLIEYARKQVDYILGENPARMSYMVGYGVNYPKHVHHRGSSLPSVKDHPGFIGSDFDALNTPNPNPNPLVGAVVGGPDDGDNFADDRNNFAQSEPATYINAPLVGLLAYFSNQHR
ncbi:unnamed protein product [Cuscuta campestris]|uniref:Endoglucanase n=1 Tax=Cuscuta campestris TaxID=132261 RepID=A0A484KD90_9ASTE|nr:unnamed protein product [Cuscuta campestris]